jgi:hypothetical protein
MRLEHLPFLIGALIGLIGVGLILDAWAADDAVSTERRRRPRRERDRFGEFLVGLGVIAIAAAFIGRDAWRYSTVTVIVGAVLMLWGSKRNTSYLKGVFVGGDRAKIVDWTPGKADKPH